MALQRLLKISRQLPHLHGGALFPNYNKKKAQALIGNNLTTTAGTREMGKEMALYLFRIYIDCSAKGLDKFVFFLKCMTISSSMEREGGSQSTRGKEVIWTQNQEHLYFFSQLCF